MTTGSRLMLVIIQYTSMPITVPRSIHRNPFFRYDSLWKGHIWNKATGVRIDIRRMIQKVFPLAGSKMG